MRQHWFLIVLFLSISTNVHAQELPVGQIPLHLGMTLPEVKASLHDPIYLDGSPEATLQGVEIWSVREKQGEAYVAIGTLQVSAGRLISIERNLGRFQGAEALDVGRVIFQALDNLHANDPTIAIRTQTLFASPSVGEVKSITIGAGQRRIVISVPTPGKNQAMYISEVVSKQPPPKKP